MKKDIIIESLPGFQPKGTIGKVSVKLGDRVEAGDLLLTVEGKKGSKEIRAEFDAEVVSLEAQDGMEIDKGFKALVLRGAGGTGPELKKEMEPSESLKTEVLVLGGGPGGYVAAIRASQNGKKVMLIEEDKLGGTCLNRGCIPTKSMVQSTNVHELIKEAGIFGIESSRPEISLDRVIDRKDQVVGSLIAGIESSMDKHRIEVLKGRGRGHSKNSILVEMEDKALIVEFENLILAPGSVVDFPPFEGARASDNLTSDELLELREIPESLIILGGRVIAMEFAFIYSRLGSKVTVIQRSDSIFPNLDEDLVEIVRESALESGIKLIEGTSVKSIRTSMDGGKVIVFDHQGEEKILAAEKLAVATGRKPNLEGLGLDKLGVEIDTRTRGIKVDSGMRTTAENIYAIGDATNLYNLAHAASKQAIIAADNIMARDLEMDYTAIPEAIFTSPEIGLVGMNEKMCRAEGIDYLVGKFPYMNNGKALVANETRGFVKVIARKDTREIIGAGLVGLAATDLLSTFTNLVANKNTIDQAKDVVYAHPTVSEVIFESILDLYGQAIHK